MDQFGTRPGDEMSRSAATMRSKIANYLLTKLFNYGHAISFFDPAN